MHLKLQDIVAGIGLRAIAVVDAFLLMTSFGLAALVMSNAVNWPKIEHFLSDRVSLRSCMLFAAAVFLCHVSFLFCNLYESKRTSTKAAEISDILRAMVLATAFLWCEGRLFSVVALEFYSLVVFWLIGSALIITSRMLIRILLRSIRSRGHNLHHILILGSNARAVDFARKAEAMPERGYRLLGFVDDEWVGTKEFEKTGFGRTSDYAGLPEFLRKNVVDEIAIFLPLRSFYERAAEIAKLANQHGILVRFDTDIFNLKFAYARTEATAGTSQIVTGSSGVEGWQFLLKRIFDVAGSLVLLVLCLPLFLFVALLIKLTSRGPVFFAQKRVGLNKRYFTMFKFRTMVRDAERIQESLVSMNEMTGPAFKIKNDPRITSIGHFLRKTSIDELPQLFNVLKGEMSFVGPRAMSVRDYQLFSEDWQRRRFSVLPGITCLWQVHGRNSLPFEQWMILDMQYIDRWSLWLDIKILALTIPAVVRGMGAS